MRVRLRGGPGCCIPAYAGRKAFHVETDGLKHSLEQAIVLKAVTTAPAMDQLVFYGIRGDIHAALQQYINGLERDGVRMALMEFFESLQGRCHGPLTTDACQVRLQVHIRWVRALQSRGNLIDRKGGVGIQEAHIGVALPELCFEGLAGFTKKTPPKSDEIIIPGVVTLRCLLRLSRALGIDTQGREFTQHRFQDRLGTPQHQNTCSVQGNRVFLNRCIHAVTSP